MILETANFDIRILGRISAALDYDLRRTSFLAVRNSSYFVVCIFLLLHNLDWHIFLQDRCLDIFFKAIHWRNIDL